MKKLIAILLLSLHLFSITACFIVHFVAVYRSDRFFEKQTSHGLYNVNELTEVKLPVDMPGIADTGYIKISGVVQFADAAYNYVKMRVTPNTVYLMCVPNYHTTRLSNQNIIHAENIPDIPVPKKQHVPFSKLSMMGQYIFAFQDLKITVPVKQDAVLTIEPNTGRLEFTLEIPQPPPKSSFILFS